MVLGEPRNEEKFARMPPVTVRNGSKDMAGFEWTGIWRGKSGVDMSFLHCLGKWSCRPEGKQFTVEGPDA